MEAIEDHRVTEGICGVTEVRGRTEWICVKKVHAKVYTHKTSGRSFKRGDPIFNTNPSVDQHYFVNRWPNRKRES